MSSVDKMSSSNNANNDNNNNDNNDNKHKKKGSIMSWFKRQLLPLIGTMNVPPYAMLFFSTIHLGLFFTTASDRLRTALLVYLGYCVVDTKSPQAPKTTPVIRFLQYYCRKAWWVQWAGDYFQVTLIKTVDLPPPSNSHQDQTKTHPYIFNYHPHGLIGMGSSIALLSDYCQFERLYPGIERSCATLNSAYFVPFYRHWLLWMGCISANKNTLEGRLSNKESVILMPGGAAEALHAHPGVFTLAIRRRKGFIRLALQTKASLVPVLGFGENDLFDTVYVGKSSSSLSSSSSSSSSSKNDGSLLWKIQQVLYKTLKFSLPIWCHFYAQPGPVTVVVGAPVSFPENATVEECHALYLKELEELYETHKANYGHESIPLEFC